MVQSLNKGPRETMRLSKKKKTLHRPTLAHYVNPRRRRSIRRHPGTRPAHLSDSYRTISSK